MFVASGFTASIPATVPVYVTLFVSGSGEEELELIMTEDALELADVCPESCVCVPQADKASNKEAASNRVGECFMIERGMNENYLAWHSIERADRCDNVCAGRKNALQ